MTGIAELQENKADDVFAGFDFGDGISVESFNSWKTDSFDGEDDFTRVVYVSFEGDDCEADSHKVSFHAKFKAGTTELVEAYAYLFSNGSEIGSMNPPCKYMVDIEKFAKQGCDEISDIRLAAALWHTKDHSKTTVMLVTVNGREYALDLCGYVGAVDLASGNAYGTSIAVEVVDWLETAIEERVKTLINVQMENAPWFQWVDADGDAVGDVLDAISLSPKVEFLKLKQLVSVNETEEVAA